MTIDLAAFPDVEAVIVTLLSDLLPDPTAAGTVTPVDLQLHLPYLRVVRVGGGDDFYVDSARVDIDTFAATRAVAHPLAELVRQRLISGPHVVGGAVIDRVLTTSAPSEIPWGDPEVRRWMGSYQVSCRRS